MKNRKKKTFRKRVSRDGGFAPLLSPLLDRLSRWDKGTMEYIKALHARGKKEVIFREIWKKRIRILVVLAIMAVLLWLYCFMAEPATGVLSEGQYVVRQPEDETVRLLVKGSDGEQDWEHPISFRVKSRQFSKKEKEQLEQEVKHYIETNLPGKNESLQNVTASLNFVTEVPGTEVSLQWVWDEEYMQASGALIPAHIPESGADTEVMAEAKWKNWKKPFHFSIHLAPPDYTKEELAVQAVKEAVSGELKTKSTEAVVKLPEKVGDTQVTYQSEEGGKSYLPVYILVFVMLLSPLIWREQQKKKLAERDAQLLVDHPGIVNKIMLLLGAGLTVRKAVERLAEEYEQSRKKGGKLRCGYEEICVLLQEMRDGMSEKKALERFGRRCRLLPYLRFSSVITQNLKKGSEGLLDILEKEAMEALEQRKERALQLGETAGTKLLFPMMLMLGLVMGIIMIPAFMTM